MNYWEAQVRAWAFQDAPLRPPANAVELMQELVPKEASTFVVMGSTPELISLGQNVIFVDQFDAMARHLLPAKVFADRFVKGLWHETLPSFGGRDVFVGDGSLNSTANFDVLSKTLASLKVALNPNGVLIHRTYLRDRNDNFDLAELAREPGTSFAALRLFAASGVARVSGDFVRTAEISKSIKRVFPDEESLLIANENFKAGCYQILNNYELTQNYIYLPERKEFEALLRSFGVVAEEHKIEGIPFPELSSVYSCRLDNG